MSNGIISVGAAPEAWGFTPERFMQMSYLWRRDGEVVWSFVATTENGKGYLSALRKAIEDDGLRVAVPTPFPHMVVILESWGFEPGVDDDPEMGAVEVWRRLSPREGASEHG